MLDPTQVPLIEADELLARFILFSGHLRSSDNTVKPEAFMPHPLVALSLTRHREASNDELWHEGNRVATLRQRTLYGRADVCAAVFLDQALTVEPKPLDGNANHVDAANWPSEKAEQKIKAIEIARRSRFVRAP